MLPDLGPRYRVLRVAGEGATGTVFEADHVALERLVAVKLLSSEAVGSGEQLERFVREAKLLARLRHPSLVALLDADVSGERPYLVTELVRGETLEARLRSRGPIPRARRLFEQLLEGLDYLHSEGCLHRDLKPGNVMIDSTGRLRLLDFGIALDLADPSRLTLAGLQLATPVYAAPEQLLQLDATAAADLYSAGLVLAAMLTGRDPYERAEVHELLQAKQAGCPPAVLEAAPAWAKPLLACLLDPDPAGRPASAAAALQELRARREAPPAPIAPKAPPAPLRRWHAAAALAFAALLVLARPAPRPPVEPAPAAPPARDLSAPRQLLARFGGNARLQMEALGKHTYRRFVKQGASDAALLETEQELARSGVVSTFAEAARHGPDLLYEPWPSRKQQLTAISGALDMTVLDRLFEILGFSSRTGARRLLGERYFRVRSQAALASCTTEILFPLASPVEMHASFKSLGRDWGFFDPRGLVRKLDRQLSLPAQDGLRSAELAIRAAGLQREACLQLTLTWPDGELTIPVFHEPAPGEAPVWLTQELPAALLAPGPVRARLQYGLLPGSAKLADVLVMDVRLRLSR